MGEAVGEDDGIVHKCLALAKAGQIRDASVRGDDGRHLRSGHGKHASENHKPGVHPSGGRGRKRKSSGKEEKTAKADPPRFWMPVSLRVHNEEACRAYLAGRWLGCARVWTRSVSAGWRTPEENLYLEDLTQPPRRLPASDSKFSMPGTVWCSLSSILLPYKKISCL